MPIASYMLRFEVEDHNGTIVFVALDSEVQKLVRHTASELIGTSEDNAKEAVMSGFSHILHKAVDFQITLNSFNMKQKVPTSFTVTRLNTNTMTAHSVTGKGGFASVKVEGISSTVDDPPQRKIDLTKLFKWMIMKLINGFGLSVHFTLDSITLLIFRKGRGIGSVWSRIIDVIKFGCIRFLFLFLEVNMHSKD
ncbi:hypothetical protein MKW98_002439 [Papaver atlanticum]|uniref:Uncharacterized protein n=1 Tax=Papaver atlanticum TaxID=357466 RepID=A0AAD4XAG3_9MAGN|nr:hypothetical protein MKW98_002439 [Papaver atlanticum]